ncbi:MAG TPA: hypothetical protein VF645_08355 [Allosphingosinicella sp.]
MFREIKENYALAWRFAAALPLIFALPVAVEAIQHVIEWRIGMFESAAMASAAENHPARSGWAYIKIATLVVMGWWVWRFLGFEGDRGRTMRWDSFAASRYSLVLIFSAVLTVLEMQVGRLLGGAFESSRHLLLAGIGLMLVAMALELYFAPWKVGAALGRPKAGLAESFKAMHGNIAWSFGLTLAMFFPVMILHYALGLLPIVLPAAAGAVLLVLDSLLVGYLAILFPTTVYIIARRATAGSEAGNPVGSKTLPLPA